MDDPEICSKSCLGCTHQGYLCRQFKYLVDENEQLRAEINNLKKIKSEEEK